MHLADVWGESSHTHDSSLEWLGFLTHRGLGKGDALGLTLGLTWRGVTPVDGLNYSVGVSGYKYEFDADEKGTADIDEFAVLFKAGVAYAF